MNPIVQKDILNVLTNVIGILKVRERQDIAEIKKLSNHTIHNASVFQDEDSVTVAVLVYALAKVLERHPGMVDYNRIFEQLVKAKDFLYKNKEEDYRAAIAITFTWISRLDDKLKMYIQEVVKEARIKKGSKIYEHGISIARTAEMMNISQWELMNYIGKTGMTDKGEDLRMIKNRIEFARSLFA